MIVILLGNTKGRNLIDESLRLLINDKDATESVFEGDDHPQRAIKLKDGYL